jgi:hypothetical protein
VTGPALERWQAANQRHLFAAIAALSVRLAPDDAEVRARAEAAEREVTAAQADLGGPAAIDALATAFGLSPFERATLLLAVGTELVPGVGDLCARAAADTRRPWLTFALALSHLEGAHWSALAPNGPLHQFRLVELDAGDSRLHGRLHPAERVTAELCGVSSLDARLLPLVEPVPAPGGELAPSQAAAVTRVVAAWRRPRDGARCPVVQLCGPDLVAKHAVAAAAAAALGLSLHVLAAPDVTSLPHEREVLTRLWEREAVLSSSALVIDVDDADAPEVARQAVALAERLSTLVAISAREPLRMRRRSSLRVDVPRASPSEQQSLWGRLLGPAGANLNGAMAHVTSQFSLSLAGLRDASAEVLSRVAEGSETPLPSLAWQACRSQSRARLEDLAQRIDARAGWDDLILPPDESALLRDLAAHVRQRALVYETWGFARTSERGLGISALFAGISGTGKTLAAEVLARELSLDLYRIDLSQVVSKYIGETEKNLRRIFEAAEEAGAVLLFDEADALFGKRSDVKDSHDRYANIEVSYLLQRMEQYRGLAVLTSNMRNALDQAFLRRLRFIVEFPFPDFEQRLAIWRRVFPEGVPLGAIDWTRLGGLNIAGGTIRNIALAAAFSAADAGRPVEMTHLLRAARSEYRKLDKPLYDVELA